ncbi:hypothetical protein BRADO3641 [Bradyrhizobium sp. ORS 278]|uniref:hypothetical protein n=1 Tax=Bradyrhizobium sp. (strain ORS 278) TaxID=114615 RepID=UPI0001508F4D|nr:hypothetical protein [Bradyrhizobium sp. ORS 278]CAL77418.1 hypothetical protein BRADO3641 [Bradyrhizobium sp. ORS 278]
MSETVTELVIDADTSGAERYSDAMDRASDAAEKGVSSAGSMSLAIAGVSAASIAAVAGLRSLFDYVGRQSQELVDLQDHAELAGMSLKEFQEDLYAARSKGLTEKDFASGLDKITSDLTQASQQATEFGKLFEANGLSIRQAGGELKTAKQALADIMGLMEGATPAVQQRLAAIVGVSASWIPFLRQGVEEFEATKQKAQDLGIIIDDATVSKARTFNSEWKSAVAAWDLQFKATLAGIMPLLVQAANLARSILDGIGAVSGSVGRWLTPIDDQSKAQLSDTINDVHRLTEMLEGLKGDASGSGLAAFKARNLAGMLGLPENVSLDQAYAFLEKVQGLYDKPQRVNIYPSSSQGNGTVLPSMGGKDEIEKATDAIEKHIAKLQADADAAGAGAGELERLRAEALLYAAAQRAGIKDTERFAETFSDLAERAGNAAAALAKAKVNAEIRFAGNTALLSQGDLAIAQRLKDIYPDVADALNSAEAAQIRFNEATRSLTSSLESQLVPGLVAIETGQKKIAQGALDMANQFGQALLQMINKVLIVEPLLRSLQGVVSSFGVPGVGSGAAAAPSAAGLDGLAAIHHSGGMAGDPGMPMRLVHPATFDHARRFHGGGIVGDEVPIIARRGEEVGWPDQLARKYGSAAPQVNVTLIESPNAQGAVTQTQNGNGGIDIEVAIAQIAAKSAARPGGAVNRVLTDQFSARGRLASR